MNKKAATESRHDPEIASERHETEELEFLFQNNKSRKLFGFDSIDANSECGNVKFKSILEIPQFLPLEKDKIERYKDENRRLASVLND